MKDDFKKLRPPSERSTGVARLALFVLALALALVAAKLVHRRLLWGVVRSCVLDQNALGSPFPCLQVNLSRGEGRGFVVLHAPFSGPHLVLSPTTRVAGVEDPRLRASGAAHYLADAWDVRKSLDRYAGRPLPDSEIGLAVNSKRGRSQDQLHIHISCVREEFRNRLRALDGRIGAANWLHLPFALRSRRYWALRLDVETLRTVNVFQRVDTLLEQSPGRRQDLTFALMTRRQAASAGFYLVADQAAPVRRGLGHAEFLLDESCGGP